MNNTIDLFTSRTGKYNDALKLKSVFLFVTILLVGLKLFSKSYYKLAILLALSAFIIEIYTSHNIDSLADINEDTMVKLDNLQQKMYDYIDLEILSKKLDVTNEMTLEMKRYRILDSFYIDANMIYFLESIINMYKYSPKHFYSLLNGTNIILKMKREMETYYKANKEYPINTADMFRRALEIKTNCMNSIHNFIFNVPKHPKFYKYHSDIMNRYDTLITKNIDAMYRYMNHHNSIKGINIETKFPNYKPNQPIYKPYNPESLAVSSFF